MRYKILTCGEGAVTVEFSRKINSRAGAAAISLAGQLRQQNAAGICEIIPTYRSVTLCYDPLKISYKELKRLIASCVRHPRAAAQDEESVRRFYIPVCYGGPFGPDLEYLAQRSGLDPREVVRRHISREYPINMIGFLPGFPYLSGMDASIAAPRLENPREKIPAGSVGIGGNQTGIYPIASPGGWRLIGRTPVRLYDPHRDPPVLYRAGDRIRFYPVSEQEYREIEAAVSAGTYAVRTEAV